MAVTHYRSMSEYTEYLRLHPEEIGELVQSFLINVTQFFRDADVFSYLENDILPELIFHARDRDRVLRIWTAGCASGEEPYSLAMLLANLLGAELPEWSVKIFATDLDEAAINFARKGLYSENALIEVPTGYRDRFFERVDQGYRIHVLAPDGDLRSTGLEQERSLPAHRSGTLPQCAYLFYAGAPGVCPQPVCILAFARRLLISRQSRDGSPRTIVLRTGQ